MNYIYIIYYLESNSNTYFMIKYFVRIIFIISFARIWTYEEYIEIKVIFFLLDLFLLY